MLQIATINVQNKYRLKNYDGIVENENYINQLMQLIEKYNLNIVGLQEVTERYEENMKKVLPNQYTYYGKFRFFKNIVTKYLYPFSKFNESVPIITNLKVLSKKTKLLPWISSYVPRIVTIMNIEIDQIGIVTVFNTHLDYRKEKTKKKQLKKLYKMIEHTNNPIILMGDFNMTTRNQYFKQFIEEVKQKKIHHVPIEEKTFKKSKTTFAIDHIFLSDCFKVEEIMVEKDKKYQTFSDHYPVILKLSLGFLKK